MITGDNAWQYFTQVMARIPFAYSSALDPTGSGNSCKLISPATKSMVQSASFTTTDTMFLASTKLPHCCNSSVRTACGMAGMLPIR